MKKFISVIIAILITSSLSGCQSGSGNKRTAGTLIGGVAGGLLGSQFGKGSGKLAATGIGALAGALVGGSVGQSLDEYDKALMDRSYKQALEFSPSGSSVEWNNPDSGNGGSFSPTKTFKSNSGMYCREFQQDVNIGGKNQRAYGTACRQPDGSWQITR